MKMSNEINELADAFSKAQGLMKNASKDASNPFFKSSYATLASVIEALREPFALNGLSFMQPCDFKEDGTILVETIILHSSGQWISGTITGKALPKIIKDRNGNMIDKIENDPQAVGSLISYLKRYGLQAMVGIASADDDAEEAMSRTPQYQAKPQPKQVAQPVVNREPSDPLFVKIIGLMEKVAGDKFADKAKLAILLEEMKVKTSSEIKSLSEQDKLECISLLEHKCEELNIV